MSSRSILMFAPASYPPVTPAALSNMKLAYTLATAGWTVHMISKPTTTKSPGRYPPELELFDHERIVIHSVEPIRGRLPLVRAALRTIFQTGFILRGFRWVPPALEKALELSRQEDFEVFYSRCTPLYAHLAGLLFAKQTGLTWFANYADPDARVRYPVPYGRGPTARVPYHVRMMARAVARHAAHLTFPSEELRQYVCSYFPGACRSKSSVIPHVALPALSASRVGSPGESVGPLTLTHVGSVKAPRDPRAFLAGLNRFLESRPEGRDQLNVVFYEQDPASLREVVKDFGLADIVNVNDPVTYGESLEVLARSDVALLVEAPMEHGVFFPSKFADYVQCGLPTFALSPSQGCIAELIRQHGGGVAVDAECPNSVHAGLERLFVIWKEGRLSDLWPDRLKTVLGPSAAVAKVESLVDNYVDGRSRLRAAW